MRFVKRLKNIIEDISKNIFMIDMIIKKVNINILKKVLYIIYNNYIIKKLFKV